MEETQFDVAIVGAGPAGSTLAALLAARGLAVAVIDKDRFPRDKVCGEFLSYDALPLLGALGLSRTLNDAGATTIDHCRVVGEATTYELSFPHPARGLSRLAFDTILLDHATACGAARLDGWTAVAIEAGGIAIQRGDESRELKAHAVVGAWGRWGRFDQILGRAFVRDRTHRSFGFKRHYLAGTSSSSIDLYSFSGGYLGVNQVERGITNICGLVQAGRLSGHRGRWEAFVERVRADSPALDALFAAHEPAQAQFLSSDPVIFRARSAVERGIFMIGDASGIIDPLAGNGMAMAVQSAFLVAPFLAETCAKRQNRVRIENGYRQAHASFFGQRIAWSRAAARLLSRPRLLDSAMRVVRTRRPGELLLRKTRAADASIASLLANLDRMPGRKASTGFDPR